MKEDEESRRFMDKGFTVQGFRAESSFPHSRSSCQQRSSQLRVPGKVMIKEIHWTRLD